MNSFYKNVFYYIIKIIATMIFPVVTYSYASRIFLPEGMGKIDFSKSIVSIFSLFAMLGIQNYGIREGSRVKNDKRKLTKLYKELLFINCTSSLLVYGLLMVAVTCIEKMHEYYGLIFLYSSTIGLTALGTEWLYSALEEFKYLAIRSCVIQSFSLVCMIYFVKKASDLSVYMAIQVLALSGVNVCNFWRARKYVDLKIKTGINLRKHIKPIFSLFLMLLFINIFTAMDSVMLGFITNDEIVGYYSASYKISLILVSVVSASSTVLIPQISFSIENANKGVTENLLNKALNYTFLLGVPITAGMAVLSKELLLLLSGEHFVYATKCATILSMRIFLSSVNGTILLGYLVPMKKDFECILVTGLTAIINIIMNVLLIPVWAHNGAAIATVGAELAEFAALLLIVNTMTNVRFLFKNMWTYFVASMPIIVTCLIIKWLKLAVIPTICIAVCFSAAVYFLLLYMLNTSFFRERIFYAFNLLKKRLDK